MKVEGFGVSATPPKPFFAMDVGVVMLGCRSVGFEANACYHVMLKLPWQWMQAAESSYRHLAGVHFPWALGTMWGGPFRAGP